MMKTSATSSPLKKGDMGFEQSVSIGEQQFSEPGTSHSGHPWRGEWLCQLWRNMRPKQTNRRPSTKRPTVIPSFNYATLTFLSEYGCTVGSKKIFLSEFGCTVGSKKINTMLHHWQHSRTPMSSSCMYYRLLSSERLKVLKTHRAFL